MARPKKQQPPSYRLHKVTGQAVVTLNGQDHYLGRYDSDESRAEYDRLVAEWLVNGRRPQQRVNITPLTMVELLVAYDQHVEQTYRDRDGGPGKEANHNTNMMIPIRRLYGRTPAACFGPLALKAVRVQYVAAGWTRGYVNEQVSRVVRMFRWAVENELVPPATLQALDEVKGLRRGMSEAREGRKVRPVPDSLVNPIKDHVSRQVWAMIELMRLTGMRAGEVLIMRTGDIDTTGEIWEYRPAYHKTEHHDHERIIALGPKAQETVGPFLRPNLQEFIFSPADAERERMEEKRKARIKAYLVKHPLARGDGIQPSQRDRSNARARRKLGDKYDVNSLRRAIERGCQLAFPAPDDLVNGIKGETDEQRTARMAALADWHKQHRWHPHQLRHAAATKLRKQYGLEVARVVLGHHSPAITELYAEADEKRALQVAREVG